MATWPLLGEGIEPISKVSVQTGTSHGGVPMADGTIAAVSIDFDTLRRLSAVARDEYGMAGCVQHGASTLPEDAFNNFPDNGTAEIHLATGFQNILYDGGGLPDDLRAEMMEWCRANAADERKEGETEEQFLYKTRKKAIGPFKRQLWTLPPESAATVGANLRAKFGLLFDELGIRRHPRAGRAPRVARAGREASARGPWRRRRDVRHGRCGGLRGRRLWRVGASSAPPC